MHDEKDRSSVSTRRRSCHQVALWLLSLAGWMQHPFDVPNHAAMGPSKGRETEILWCVF